MAIAFGSGSVGTAIFVIAPQLLLLFYMTELLGIPAAWAGVVLVIPKLWELVTDPWLGWVSDRSTTRWGRRKPFLLAGALLFPPAFALMFAVPDFADWPARLIFVTVAYVAATTAYSLFAVPFVALPGDLASDPNERTRIVAYRMAFVAIGILIAGAVAPALVEHWGGGRDAYRLTGAALAIICGTAMLATVAGARSGRVEPGVRSEPFWRGMRAVTGARAYRSLGATYFVQMISNGANAAMLAYAARYLLGAGEALVGLFFAVFTLSSLIATPVFAILGRRWGKRGGLVRATFIYVAAMLLLYFAEVGDSMLLLTASAIAGVASAGTQLFIFALLPDVIEAERRRTGVAREGIFAGVWIAGEKLGLAAGAALAALVLGLSGFVEGAVADQPASALAAIAAMFSVVPALLLAVSLLFLAPNLNTEHQDAV